MVCTGEPIPLAAEITSLANSDIVEQIRELVEGRNVGPLKEGPEDIKRFGDER